MSPRRDQGDAGREPVRAEAAGHSEGAQVEQVHEVGVGPQQSVGPDRVGGEFRARHGARVGRHGEHVDAVPERVGGSAQLFQAVPGGEGVRRAERLGPGDHRAGRGVQRLGVGLQQRADRLVAFGDPGTIVEERRHREHRCEVDGPRAAHQLGEVREARVERGFRQAVAVEPAAARVRHAEAQSGR